MRVLVCGGRRFDDKNKLVEELQTLLLRHDLEIIEGGAPGADTMAYQWCASNSVVCHHYPAEWSRYGYRAGPIRNQKMIDDGRPDLVLAFPGGKGTADMIRRAEAAGIEVRKIDA